MTESKQQPLRDPVPIPALTGFRIFLALFVVFYHSGQSLLAGAPAIFRNLGGSGYISVSVFFLLSGFVLAYNHLGARTVGAKTFWIARLARIAPAYWTALCIGIPFLAHSWLNNPAEASWATIATALTCTQAWFVKLDLWNFPAWSLSCECFFYLLFPAFVRPIMRLDRSSLRWFILATGLLSMLPPAVYFLWLPDGVPFASLTQAHITHYTLDPATLDFRSRLTRAGFYGNFMYNPVAHLPVFLLGMALGRYKLAFAERRSTLAVSVMPYASLLFTFGILAASGLLPHLALHNSLIAVGLAGFIFYADTLWGPLARLLAAPVVVLLGEASYAVYILQVPLWQVYDSLMRHLHLGFPAEQMTVGLLVGFLVFLCATAVITFLAIERPCRKIIRKTLTDLDFGKRSRAAVYAGNEK